MFDDSNSVKQDMAEEQAFEIPEQLLNSLNECTAGGFALFTFDDEGSPQAYIHFDNELHSLAIQRHIANWLASIDVIEKQLVVQKLLDDIKASRRGK